MGAVNYFTSDYITMGLRPYDTSDFENDCEFMKELQDEVDEYGGLIQDRDGTLYAITARNTNLFRIF